MFFSEQAIKKNLIGKEQQLDLLLANFDYFKNKRMFPAMLEVVGEVAIFLRREGVPEAQSHLLTKAKTKLLNVAEELQGQLGANSSSFRSPQGEVLASLYEAMAESKIYSNKEEPKIYFNAAELRFAQGDFAKADQFYRSALTANNSIEIRMKALSARMERLKQNGTIPTKITIFSMKNPPATDTTAEAEEWLKEVKELSNDSRNTKMMIPFRFAAYRFAYSLGRVEEAVRGMESIAKDSPASEFAIPALTLALDTYVTSSDWQKCQQVVKWAKIQGEWASTMEFQGKLKKLESALKVKQVEIAYQNKDYDQVIKKAQEELRSPEHKEGSSEILAMAANALLTKGDQRGALKLFTELKAQDPSRKGLRETISTLELTLAEGDFAIAKAASILIEQFKSDIKTASKDLKQKLLLYSWLAGNGKGQEALKTGVCDKDSERSCQLAKARSFNFSNKGEENDTADLKVARALASLTPEEASSEAGISKIEKISNDWKNLDPLTSYFFQPRLTVALQQVLGNARKTLSKKYPSRADEKKLKARVQASERLDEKMGKFFDSFTSSSARKLILAERASLFDDLANEITKIKVPDALKGADLSQFEQTLREVALPFERKQSELRKILEEEEKHSFCCKEFPLLSMTSTLFSQEKQKSFYLAASKAFEEKNTALLAFLTQEAKSRGILTDGLFDFMVAVVSISAGETEEALSFLESATKKLSNPGALQLSLLRSYAGSGLEQNLKETAAQLANSVDLQRLTLSKDDEAVMKKLASTEKSEIAISVNKILQKTGRNRAPASTGEKP